MYFDQDSCLRYRADAENNYIADFSHAGYRNGEVELPSVPTVVTIDAVEGDNTANIQSALDELAARQPDADGYRGALLLNPGLYRVSGQLFMRESGMVLRGAGQGSDPSVNTVIVGVGNSPTLRNLIVVSGASVPTWTSPVAGTTTNITSEFVPAGSRTLEVAAAEFYRRGDQVVITQPSTLAWLASIDNGATAADDSWAPGEIDIFYNRTVTGVNIRESKVTLDAPIYDHLDRTLAQSTMYVLDNRSIIRECGIENLRIDVETAGPLDEDHVRTTIFLRGVEDSWIKDVTAEHFSYALVDMSVANRVTVADCSALEPHSPIMGGRRYNFNVSSFTNNILFTRNYATEGRHSSVSNGTSSSSGIVWTNSISDRDLNPSEGHRRWGQGLLYDKIDFRESNTRNLIGLYNRGDFGTGHGWASTNSVAWNVTTPPTRGIIIQKPPARQNYAVGCSSNVTGVGPFNHPAGYIELTNQQLAISSLYAAQLAHRMAKGVAPDAPARLRQVFLPDGTIGLFWSDVAANETGYEVVVSTDDGLTNTVIATLPPNSTDFTLNFPTEAGIYLYRVYATGTNCPSPFSNPITIERTVNVQEATAEEFAVFPNPVSGLLTIRAARPYDSLEVLDATGRLVSKRSATNQLDMSDLAPGFYYLRIKDMEGRVRSVRVVKK